MSQVTTEQLQSNAQGVCGSQFELFKFQLCFSSPAVLHHHETLISF